MFPLIFLLFAILGIQFAVDFDQLLLKDFVVKKIGFFCNRLVEHKRFSILKNMESTLQCVLER
jgi:hypothetical protein